MDKDSLLAEVRAGLRQLAADYARVVDKPLAVWLDQSPKAQAWWESLGLRMVDMGLKAEILYRVYGIKD